MASRRAEVVKHLGEPIHCPPLTIRTNAEQQAWIDGYSVGYHDAIGNKQLAAREYKLARSFALASGIGFAATIVAILLWWIFK